MNRSQAVRDQIDVLSRVEGFFEASVVFALLRLDLFETIGRDGASVSELSQACGADPARLARLLRCAAAMGFVQTSDGRHFKLSRAVGAVLLKDTPDVYLGDWLRFLETLYGVFARLDQAVVEGRPVIDLAGELAAAPEAADSFNRAMDTYARLRGRELADDLELADCHSVLDLGCGPGTYAYHLAMSNPQLELTLADLPVVIDQTRRLPQWQGVSNPIHYLSLDLLEAELPASYDVILISNTLHMLGHDDSRSLIRRLFHRVNPGGSLVIQAQFLDREGLGPRWPAILDLIMLCGSRRGQNHSVEETMSWLADAGFEESEHRPLSLLNTNSYIRAYRPVRRTE